MPKGMPIRMERKTRDKVPSDRALKQAREALGRCDLSCTTRIVGQKARARCSCGLDAKRQAVAELLDAEKAEAYKAGWTAALLLAWAQCESEDDRKKIHALDRPTADGREDGDG